MTLRAIDSSEIAREFGIAHIGSSIEVRLVTTLDRPRHGAVAFCVDDESPMLLKWDGVSGVLIAREATRVPASCVHLVAENPRAFFGGVLEKYFEHKIVPRISPHAAISETAVIGQRVSIAEFAVIDADVVIGDDSVIGPGVHIHRGGRVGTQVSIGANSVIGSVGFGLEQDDNGEWVRIPHVGNVVIEDQVEIGACVVIARGTIHETRIRRNAKIDDLVFIAHNVEIGENAVVIANAEISGSVKVGRNAWIGPSATVINQVSVGDDALVGIGAVVTRDVPVSVIVAGNPARVLRSR